MEHGFELVIWGQVQRTERYPRKSPHEGVPANPSLLLLLCQKGCAISLSPTTVLGSKVLPPNGITTATTPGQWGFGDFTLRAKAGSSHGRAWYTECRASKSIKSIKFPGDTDPENHTEKPGQA